MQSTFRANLSAANFPFLSTWMGRSVVVPQYDENFQRRASFSGDDPDLDIGIPQMYYCHNVMPVGQGLTSVAFSQFIPALATGLSFTRILGVEDVNLKRAFLATTLDNRIFIYSEDVTTWTEVAIPNAGWNGKDWTYANVSGIPYICLAKNGIYTLNITARTFSNAVLSGVTNAQADGIFSSNNYLLIWSGNLVAWSSALDSTDFVPSTTTGAGSGIPIGLQGSIVTAKQLSTGWVVYSTENAVNASYSGNTRYPWVFRPIANCKGIGQQSYVADNADNGTNYIWSTAGIMQVQSSSASVKFPEATDFLAGKVFEDWDPVLKDLVQSYLDSPLVVRMKFIGARFLVISYGITSFTHALVYDTGFKRWGKLKVDHTDVFELVESALGMTVSWTAKTGTWGATSGTWDSQIGLSSATAIPKKTAGFMQANGKCVYVNFDYGNFAASAVVLLGKYQLTRSQLCGIQGMDVEEIPIANTSFALQVQSTIDGKTLYTQATAYGALVAKNTRRYYADVIGVNHTLVFTGSFNLVSVLLILSRHGRM